MVRLDEDRTGVPQCSGLAVRKKPRPRDVGLTPSIDNQTPGRDDVDRSAHLSSGIDRADTAPAEKIDRAGADRHRSGSPEIQRAGLDNGAAGSMSIERHLVGVHGYAAGTDGPK